MTVLRFHEDFDSDDEQAKLSLLRFAKDFASGDEQLRLSMITYLAYGGELPPLGASGISLSNGFGSSKPGVVLYVLGFGKKGEATGRGDSVWGDDYILLGSSAEDVEPRWLCEIPGWWHRFGVLLEAPVLQPKVEP